MSGLLSYKNSVVPARALEPVPYSTRCFCDRELKYLNSSFDRQDSALTLR